MMTPAAPRPSAEPALWTCPLCPLLCDDLALADAAGACAVAARGLSRLDSAAEDAPGGSALVAGQAVPQAQALHTAAAWLARSQQPLFAGLGTDVAGARALQPLARGCGAIVDAASGRALSEALRAQQDRGGFSTTLAEVRERADLILFVGSWAPQRLPRLLPRLLRGRADTPPALVALLGADAPAQAEGLPVETVLPGAERFSTLAQACALQAGRAVRQPEPALQALCERLAQARYAVLVWEPGQLGPQAGLLIERLQQWVGLLNQRGRAAGLPLPGSPSASTVQQVWLWRTGWPLRSRSGPFGPEHEPQAFDTQRLLADRAVDLLVWVDAWGTDLPHWPGRRVVIGPPRLTAQLGATGDMSQTVFLPVATPGVHHPGHLCRGDGTVMLPLYAPRPSAWPSVAGLLADWPPVDRALEAAP